MNTQPILPEEPRFDPWLIAVALLVLAIGYSFIPSQKSDHIGIEFSDNHSLVPASKMRQQAIMVEQQLLSLKTNKEDLDPALRAIVEQPNHKENRLSLLELAALAVESGDRKKLADTLLLLSEESIDALELHSSEVYLEEVLALAEELDDPVLKGRVYQQFGRLNIKHRNLARRSAYAYDMLLVARNRIALEEYGDSLQILQTVIDDNLKIKRFGAAASAWETVAQYHRKQFDQYQVHLATVEAAKLYAVSGRALHARTIIKGLDEYGTGPGEIEALLNTMDELEEQHEADINQTASARDHESLYNHYKNIGDEKRAWEFRLKANQSLLKTSERSMYQRQPDVLAILYNSNFAMDRAEHYLGQARELFSTEGEQEFLLNTREMEKLIF